MRVKAELKSTVYFALKALTKSKLRQNLAWLSEKQYLPFEQLKETQNELLLRLCEIARTGVPSYRERFSQAGFDRGLGDLNVSTLPRLPLLSRYELVNNPSSFIRSSVSRKKFRFVKTGGSTGTPAQIGQDAYYHAWCFASHHLFNSWVGLSVGDPYLFLWGAARDIVRQRERFPERLNMSFLQGRCVLDATQMSVEKMRAFVDIINRRSDCQYLTGYANEIFNLACYSLENQHPIDRPLRAVMTTAENLTEPMREVIERAFRCKVLNKYGCRDIGDIACECPYQRGIHINPLFCHVEVADEAGRPLPYGQEGQLIVTSLHNYVMPLIRYAIGDMGVLKPAERCACGREWETIVQLTGRTSEVLRLPNGVHSRVASLHGVFEELPLLKRYQIHQLDYLRLLIKLRSASPNYVSSYAQELERAARKIRLQTGVPLEIEFEQTDVFEKTPTGKELVVVRKHTA